MEGIGSMGRLTYSYSIFSPFPMLSSMEGIGPVGNLGAELSTYSSGIGPTGKLGAKSLTYSSFIFSPFPMLS